MNKIFSLFLLLTTTVMAKPDYAISRFGQPKHTEAEKSMPYLNPLAPKGGRLRMANLGSFDSLNRFVVKGFPAEGLTMCYDTLMKRAADDPHSMYGLVAEKVDLAPNSSEMIFYLNPKAKFHDGHPIKAEDVKFSIDTLRDKGLPRYKKYYSKIKEIKVIGDYTIKLTFNPDEQGIYDKELPIIMGNLVVLPKHILEGKDFSSLTLEEIPGSGPYKIKSYELGRKIIFERVKDYWAADLPLVKGANNFDTISIEYFKSDHALRESLKAGEVDFYMEPDQKSWNTAYDFPAVKDSRVIKMEAEHKRPVAVRTIIFNMKKPIFEDRRVRKAIAMAFDFNQINKTQYHNAFKPMTSLFANTHFVPKGKPSAEELKLLAPFKDQLDAEISEDAIKIPEGDRRQILQKAGQLLTDAGWVIEKGIRVNKKTKQPLTFTFTVKDPRIEGLALEFQRNLKPLGIHMKVAKIDTTQYEKQSVEKTFDVILHTWANSLSPGIEQTYYFDPKMADQPGSSNYIGIKNDAIFSLAQKVANANSEPDLKTAVKALDRAVMGMYYMIPGVYDNVTCIAYWKARLDYPAIKEDVGTNVPEWWWAKS
ncbi:extracellular solute-binding protein [Candidatus Odyssella acanthamoebae]|uniref:extracellular solute-binding protein n=1 Tax=Candidatus Odyssella acanthamoebae TaxID=91604 RepID=UPI0018DE4C08|nr:extracellular solute-binding protein [Candidatus Paracaedibacter acanthamoebae]